MSTITIKITRAAAAPALLNLFSQIGRLTSTQSTNSKRPPPPFSLSLSLSLPTNGIMQETREQNAIIRCVLLIRYCHQWSAVQELRPDTTDVIYWQTAAAAALKARAAAVICRAPLHYFGQCTWDESVHRWWWWWWWFIKYFTITFHHYQEKKRKKRGCQKYKGKERPQRHFFYCCCSTTKVNT